MDSKDNEKKEDVELSSETSELLQKKIELSLEDVFVNLTLISKIEVGNKLVQSEKHVNIDTSYFPSISRWYYGVNRNDNLNFIRLVLSKAFEINDKLLDDSEDEQNGLLLLRLNTDFKNSLHGLLNLKQTYYYDKLIQAEIDVMIDNIRSKLDLNSKAINFTRTSY